MSRCGGIKRLICAAALLLLPRLLSVPAYAQPLQSSKGAVPASSTYIDRSTYTDASLYTNKPVDLGIVRVGLSYGENAKDEAEFSNLSGQGFSIGVYGEDRRFTELTTVSDSRVTVKHISGALFVYHGKNEQLLYTAKEDTDALALMPLGVRALTQYGEDRFHGGFECRINGEGSLTVINYVELEDYVKGVVPYEMGYNWPYEALRAQAVCARTYAVYNRGEYGEQGFDITGDTYSQVYRGTLWANETTDAAADSTAGQLVRYKGEICEIYYSAADGGATEDGAIMFGSDRPYLSGKTDPFELAQGSPYDGWTVRRSGEQLATRLNKLDYEIGDVTEIEPKYSQQGNVIAVELWDGEGHSVQLNGRECYSALGLNSCRYTVELTEDGFTFSGNGLGHNCGLSQWGAYAMAGTYGYDYEDIIRFYFTGAYVA